MNKRVASPTRSAASESGFVLIAALAVVLIGSMWSANAAQRMSASFQSGLAIGEDAAARMTAQDGIASTIYVALTAPRSACGFQPDSPYVESDFQSGGPDLDSPCFRVDGREYDLGGATVAIQDWGGLASVRLPRTNLIDDLASRVTEAPPTHTFAGSIQDYSDLNEDTRFLGAEAAEYAERGLPPPRNRWPRTPVEAFDALGWEALARPGFADLVGIGLNGSIAINSAPRGVLDSMPEVKADRIEALLEGRSVLALQSGTQLRDYLQDDYVADIFSFSYLANAHLRVRSGRAHALPVMETSVRITGTDSQPLWILDYAIPTAQNPLNETAAGQDARVPSAGRDGDSEWLRSRR